MAFRYFGTDGIRGKANEGLTPEIAYKVGRFLGYKLSSDQDCKFLIGRDTRLSGEMLESSLAAGLMASGCHVDLLGVVVTPLVAHVLKQGDYVGGIMITASHNPYYDNGLKIMNPQGMKIDEFLQSEIEDYLDGKIEIPYRVDDKIGVSHLCYDLIDSYKNSLKETFNGDLQEIKLAVDAANGSTSYLSEIFKEMGVDATIINNEPNGLNINDHCGSTHPEHLQEFMKGKDFDLGVAFDGDGDRLVFVDHNNKIVDGDGIIYVLSNHYMRTKQLTHDTVVVTVMSNLGLHNALKKQSVNLVVTDVGDKNVFEKMESDHYVVGGEQSGHIIIKEHSNMGDGLLVTLKILSIMSEMKQSLAELTADLRIYPQLLKNTRVKDKDFVLSSEILEQEIRTIESELKDNGRVLVRASGTEPLIRVMVEAETDDLCAQYVDRMIDIIKRIEA